MTNDLRSVVAVLHDLIKLDQDAVTVYVTAIRCMDVPAMAERLRGFQREHEQHVRILSAELRRLGGKVPQRSDLQGPFRHGFSSVTSSMSLEVALRAMSYNENLTHLIYSNALREPLPSEVYDVLEDNFRDETRHLAFTQTALRNRIWESADARI